MLEKKVVIDKVEVLEDGQIQVRQATKIMEDGKEIGKTYHHHVLSPGDDLTGQDERVKAVAEAVWIPEVIKEYKLKIKEQQK